MKDNEEKKTSSNDKEKKVTVVQTDKDSKIGQDKCPKCGSTDISVNKKTGLLRCNFCRHEFDSEKISGLVTDLKNLEGEVITSGAKNISNKDDNTMTLKCESCGAEVVIDTSETTQARCHWCRNTLSINKQIENGAVPDVVLPFSVSKEDAKSEIEKFVHKRQFFANPKFKREFTTENIMGVYFPYMLVDVNSHAKFIGEGEHQTRRYTVGSGDDQETRYDADLYYIEREFDLVINELSIESNSDRLNNLSKEKTNNIINSIMPFDTENCVKYNSNYLRGYTSEKRDVNKDDLKKIISIQSKDIARFAANESLKTYDRGVRWDTQDFNVKGQQWKAAYLPVWLYSYQQVSGNKKILHYVAVNARTKETMGSVPIHMPKLIAISVILEIFGFIAFLFTAPFSNSESDSNFSIVFLFIGIIFYIVMYLRYRNSNARHTYELETKKEISNLRKVDNFIKEKKGLRSSIMDGANNTRLDGDNTKNSTFGSILNNDAVRNVLGEIKISNNNNKEDK